MFATILLLAQLSVPGTYSVLGCRETCTASDSALIVARGFLVLASDHMGCFEMTRRKDHHSYIALGGRGYTDWGQPAGTDSLVFRTYRSPDAGHDVRVVLSDSGFVGVGHSWGAGVASIEVPDEFMLGHRTGPAEMNKCAIYREYQRSKWAAPLIMGAATLGAVLAIISAR